MWKTLRILQPIRRFARCGLCLGYLSAQLGHADVGITARHYARWCGTDTYRVPMPLYPGEVPADLMARLESPESPPTFDAASDAHLATPREHGGSWRAQQGSNLRPPGPQPGALSN